MSFKLPKELNRTTPLSRGVALILFISLPFISFLAGYKYGVAIGKSAEYPTINTEIFQNKKLISTSALTPNAQLTYRHEDIDIFFQYPAYLRTKENASIKGNSIILHTFIYGNASPSASSEKNSPDSINLSLIVYNNPQKLSVTNFLKQPYNNLAFIDNKNVKKVNKPTSDSYLYQGSGSNNIHKSIIFSYKDKLYILSLTHANSTATKYSPLAEKLFDTVVESIILF